MHVAAIGGTGDLGARVVAELAARGDTVTSVSRHAPRVGSLAAATIGERVAHRVADVEKGTGLAEALAGAEVVVNAFGDRRGRASAFVGGARNLLGAEAAAGIRHHVEISIVGTDRSAFRYHRVIAEKERVVAGGPIPWTVLRATQFHTLVARLFRAAGRVGLVPTGTGTLQPVAPSTVAEHLAAAAHHDPAGRLPDLGGPRVQTVAELARDWRAAHGGIRLPLPLPRFGAAGEALHSGILCTADGHGEGPTFAAWLAAEPAAPPVPGDAKAQR
jgi:uncharacterized protein YbjT (DUF2867 family)